ncbi:D-arabinono-1,4-lactone oxidase [Ophidiomyces ophidiicola]|nr:D-arabinono-1,4-lactone oxidase [Ophidiomyces ophidiicola]
MDSFDPQVAYELSKLDPNVPFRAIKAHLHHTWAKTFYSRPELYIQPESVAEIQKVVNLARRCRRRLVTVGSGHSPSDLTCSSSWIINLDNFRRILSFSTETGIVTVESGIRLWQLGDELEKRGLMLPNLGSIDSQSISGVISTGTHGSSLRFGLLSDSVLSLSIVLANGQVVRCSNANNSTLFRAALISLGAIGIITEMTIQAVPTFNIAWKQVLKSLPQVLEDWDTGLWTSSEYVRVWWLPYLKRAVVWRADKAELELRNPPSNFYGGRLGNAIYQHLLYLSTYFPRLLPWIEWFIFGMQYGFKPEKCVTEAVQPGRTGLLMNCLYSQFVNEWAIPLEKGPEAITRMSAWLNGDTKTANIPFSPKDVYVHSPIEVRVSDTSKSATPRPYLDPSNRQGPTLYLNATLYRPHLRNPPCTERYYEAFEWLMRELGGRPHWAKNFTETLGPTEFHNMYGNDLDEWLQARNEADPEGMFLGEWHRRTLLPAQKIESDDPFPLAEREQERRRFGKFGAGDGLEWIGKKAWTRITDQTEEGEKNGTPSTPSPPATTTSEESFDYLARGEASIMVV